MYGLRNNEWEGDEAGAIKRSDEEDEIRDVIGSKRMADLPRYQEKSKARSSILQFQMTR